MSNPSPESTQSIVPDITMADPSTLYADRLLKPYEKVWVDPDSPLRSAEAVGRRMGIHAPLVAAVQASSMRFVLLDTRQGPSDRPFLITTADFTAGDNHGYKGISQGEIVNIGRNQHTDRFDYPGGVSRLHFSAIYDKLGLSVQNFNPRNHTYMTAYLLNTAPANAASARARHDVRTDLADERIQSHPDYRPADEAAPHGYYKEHPIVGRRSTSVTNGVQLGGSAREAVVVDSESAELRGVYSSIASDIQVSFARGETLLPATLLGTVRRIVRTTLPYDLEKTIALSEPYYGDQLINLSTYLKARAGVCTQHALLAAYCIERLILDGYLHGSIGVERNERRLFKGAPHAWAIFHSNGTPSEEDLVVDTTQGFIGTKEQARQRGLWDYGLTTDPV